MLCHSMRRSAASNAGGLYPTTNMSFYYKFDGDVTDSFGSNDGTANGSPTYTTDRNGDSNSAILLGSGKYVSFPAAIGFDTKGTIVTHFKMSSVAGVHELFIDREDGNNNFRLFIMDSVLYATGYDNGAYQFQITTAVAADTYYGLLVSFDDNDARAYLQSGVGAASQFGSDTSVNMDPFTHVNINLGYNPGSGLYCAGQFDDLVGYSEPTDDTLALSILDNSKGAA